MNCKITIRQLKEIIRQSINQNSKYKMIIWKYEDSERKLHSKHKSLNGEEYIY